MLLDGVFNHVSSDSPWFDRARRFAEIGACEMASSAYRSWFTFRQPKPNEPSPCAASTTGGNDTYYTGWFGFDTIPELIEQPAVQDLFTGADGVVRTWVRAGTAGWRLDVMDNLSHGFMRKLRSAVKETNPDALVLGEQWLDSSAWLLGDQADSTMNYRFRRAVIGLVNGDTADLDGAIAGLTPTQFAERMKGVQEDYPAAAWNALLNLVDSHDTTRILWTLAPGKDNPAEKESAGGPRRGEGEAARSSPRSSSPGPGWPRSTTAPRPASPARTTRTTGAPTRGTRSTRSSRTGTGRWARRGWTTSRCGRATSRSSRPTTRPARSPTSAAATTEAAVVVLNLSAEARTVTVDLAGRIPAGTSLLDVLGGDGANAGAAPLTIELAPYGSAVLVTAPGTDLAPPAAPAQPSASWQTGRVELTWDDVPDAASYDVWRSFLPGGGYELVGTTTQHVLADTSVRNGMHYYYVVTARDAAGNEGARSPETDARPAVELASARLDAPATLSQPLSAVDPGAAIAALVAPVAPGSAAAGVGIRAQLGVGDAAGVPADDYAWSEMTFAADVDGGVRFTGSVRPETLGTFNVVLRVSTDGGATWSYADRGGIVDRRRRRLGAIAPTRRSRSRPSRVPTPSAPPSRVRPAWRPSATARSRSPGTRSTDADLYRYEVLRGKAAGGPYELIGTATEPRFTDNAVSTGAAYVYVVTAVDTSFNRSAPSAETSASAETRAVAVTFTVTLPADTPPGDTIFIAGDFQGWDPAATPMTKVDDRTWSITVPFTEGDAPQYKYTRGSWEAVEKDAGCGEIPNRTVAVEFGEDGTMRVPDEVVKWRDIAQCG